MRLMQKYLKNIYIKIYLYKKKLQKMIESKEIP